MPSYLYKVENNNYSQIDKISLSGWVGLVYKIFECKNLYHRLSEEDNGIGWEITKEDLNKQIIADDWGIGDYEIVFDIEPKKKKTNLMQLECIHVFSHNYGDDCVYWSVLMLELKSVLYHNTEIKNKENFIPDDSKGNTKEFLYLQGDDGSWNYGMVGRMNAALLEPDAVDYFRQYF